MKGKKPKQEFVTVGFRRTHSYGMRWTRAGECFRQVNDGVEERCPDMDFGTPSGDLLIDPWMQDAMRETKK